jgi:hypothetical protein
MASTTQLFNEAKKKNPSLTLAEFVKQNNTPTTAPAAPAPSVPKSVDPARQQILDSASRSLSARSMASPTQTELAQRDLAGAQASIDQINKAIVNKDGSTRELTPLEAQNLQIAQTNLAASNSYLAGQTPEYLASQERLIQEQAAQAELARKYGSSAIAPSSQAPAPEPASPSAATQQQVQQERFNKSWAENYGRLSEKEVWLKDQSSPEYKRTVELLQRVPFLTAMPDGLVHAVELMKLQDTAGRSQSLESENKALKEQLNKLQQKTAIGKSVPAGQLKTEEKDFSRLSMKEQRDALMRASREFDREGN